MKILNIHLVVLIIAVVAAGACTNKKLENNIKSLEKRVAELEKRSGIAPTKAVQPVAASQQSPGEVAVISFEETDYDFGTVQEGDIVNYTFKFTNTGSAPLLISKATATCGCTVPQWPKEPVGIGETGEIQVKFNTKNRRNMQTKYVNINANTKPAVTRLKISGNVLPNEDTNS
jgi:hypothetical protein